MFARFTSATSLECISPTHVAAVVPVEISLNGQQFTRSLDRLFHFREELSIISISPFQGPVIGGITIYLTGTYFSHNEVSHCRFRTTMSLSTVIAETMIKCLVPPMGVGGHVPVEVMLSLNRKLTGKRPYHCHRVIVATVSDSSH